MSIGISDEGPRSDPVQRALIGCGRNTNGASVSSTKTSNSVTISVKRVSGHEKPTYVMVAIVTTLNEPARRKRTMRSGDIMTLSRRLSHLMGLNCERKGGPGQREASVVLGDFL